MTRRFDAAASGQSLSSSAKRLAKRPNGHLQSNKTEQTLVDHVPFSRKHSRTIYDAGNNDRDTPDNHA